VAAEIGVYLDLSGAVIVDSLGDGAVRRIAAKPGARAPEDLQAFFSEVVAVLGEASSIFVFGPGATKEEFKDRLERDGLRRKIDGIETTGLLTGRQIAAKTRARFRRP
jgi:hypothetical protein